MPRPVHLRGEASLDQAPVGADALWQLALVKVRSSNERHHVDIDWILCVLSSHWEAVPSNVGVHVDWSQIKRLWPGLISLFEKTGDETKRKKFEEKKREWEKLQKNETKEVTGEKECEGRKTNMDFVQMIDYVKNN